MPLPRCLTTQTTLKYVTCLLLARIADSLFYDEHIAWTAGLFGMFLLSGMCLHRSPVHRGLPSQVALGASAGLSLAMVENVNSLVITMFAITVAAFALIPRLKGWDDARTLAKAIWKLLFSSGLRSFYLLPIASFYLIPAKNPRQALMRLKILFGTRMGGWPQMLYDSILVLHSRKPAKQKHGYHQTFMRYWLLPLGFSALFIVLFSQANPVIANWLKQIDWNWSSFTLSFGRILFWLTVSLGCWLLIRPRIRWQAKQAVAAAKSDTSLASLLFNRRSVITSLLLFNTIFLIQNLVDISLLLEPINQFNLARYAKHGAYPLIATVLLAAFFVLVAFRPNSETEHSKPVRLLVYGWIGQNVFLLATAAYRLLCYIEVYSLTYLRVATLIWMALAAFGLILISVRIYHDKSSRWLVNSNAFALYATLYVSCFVNWAGLIADYNVRHCQEITGAGAWLDVNYLSQLGVNAIPAMVWFEEQNPDPSTANTVSKERNLLQHRLRENLNDWHRWSFRDYRLYHRYEL